MAHALEDSGRCPENKGPVIYCVWHNRLLAGAGQQQRLHPGPLARQRTVRDDQRQPRRQPCAKLVQRFGVQPIRGSTSRRGPQALLEATTWMERGYSIVILPDGPRGPAYQIQEGIIYLAQLTGRPIIPTSTYTRWKIRLRSWDRFQIPLPFACCKAYFGEPIRVPREASDAERELLRARLEASMRAITRE